MPKITKVGIGADHRGYKLKERLKLFLVRNNYKVFDYGTFSTERTDYPEIAFNLCRHIKNIPQPQRPTVDIGILICGSGLGMSIAANKVKGIRAALCLTPKFAKRAREHNNANVLVLASDFTDFKTAQKTIKTFLTTSFLGGRHTKRIRQISDYEKLH
ncbi:MAG: ribose 5-phosphate isomerase B [candidate division WOR-3 bacterium]|nr:ribose 5-phosphate isomerase B [candidate division WOR-3 bacterium]MDW7988294.1 ribose 5-phosphate isomerase B [candidate division WOR-3 bacterium]